MGSLRLATAAQATQVQYSIEALDKWLLMRYDFEVVHRQLSSPAQSATSLGLTQSQKSPNPFRIRTKVLHNPQVQKRAARTFPLFPGAFQNGATS
jgi:hypothetical protein